jgi:hypothetical protein
MPGIHPMEKENRLRSFHVLFSVLFLTAVAHAQSPTTAPTTQPISGKRGTPVQLFNGKDLSGWKWTGQTPGKMEETWTVNDGVLHETGKPTGYLSTDKQFGGNYILIVEQRHLQRGGGGILFGITGEDKVWPVCMQVQGSLGSYGDLVNQGKFKWTVDQSRYRASANDSRVFKSGPMSEKPMNEWNTVVLIVDHGTVSVEVNGVLQNVAKDMPGLSGAIGLQAEGAAMEFRKIELIPID